jgi:acetoin utilization deacetylase AcuC-like enzyme
MIPFLYYNRSHVFHAPQGHHPECPERVEAIVRHLEPYVEAGKLNQKTYHFDISEEYAELPPPSWTMADGDTYETPYTKDIVHVSDRMIRDAVQDLTSGYTRAGFVLCRPPGHHAADRPAGFCHRNNAWTAVNALRDRGFKNISIYDWDAHHGDGTQKLVECHNYPGLRFASSHAFGAGVYPYSGAASQTHNVLNVPLPVDSRSDDLLNKFDRKILPFLTDAVKTDVFIVSAGYDGHIDDPMRLLRFETWAYEILSNKIKQLNCPVLFLLEGGYNPPVLAHCVEATLVPWMRAD